MQVSQTRTYPETYKRWSGISADERGIAGLVHSIPQIARQRQPTSPPGDSNGARLISIILIVLLVARGFLKPSISARLPVRARPFDGDGVQAPPGTWVRHGISLSAAQIVLYPEPHIVPPKERPRHGRQSLRCSSGEGTGRPGIIECSGAAYADYAKQHIYDERLTRCS